jgi:copper chaperone CopZ
MTCDHCRYAVTAEVSAVPGVETVAVDVDSGTVAGSATEAGYTLLP